MPIETQLNGRITTLLDRMNPRWTALGENKGAFQGSQKQPDMLIVQPGGQPVVIETSTSPRATWRRRAWNGWAKRWIPM